MKKPSSILIPGIIYVIILLGLLLAALFFVDSDRITRGLLLSVAIFIVLGGTVYFSFWIYAPLNTLKQRIKSLAESDIIKNSRGLEPYEYKEINNLLDQHMSRLQEIIHVADKLSEGEVVENFKVEGEFDKLGKSLLRLKNSILKSNIETEKRRKLDEQENWASQGLARFGDMVRDFDQHPVEIANRFISELVKYVEVEVGGIFLKSESENQEPVYVMKGAYAFDREKQSNAQFREGEGLVGRCVIEKQRIVITEMPENYIRIRSGLGEDLPATLVLVPIILDEEVLGVIELATFSILKQYKIDFLETLGRSIAPSVSKATGQF